MITLIFCNSAVIEYNGPGWIRTPLNARDTSLRKDNKSTTDITQAAMIKDAYENSRNSDFKQKLTAPKLVGISDFRDILGK